MHEIPDVIVFPVRELAGTEVLAGVQAGRRLLSKLISSAPNTSSPCLAYLDLSGVNVATSSFIRESILGFRDYTRSSLPNVYPVIANAAPAVLEELEFIVTRLGDAVWCCELDAGGAAMSRIVGVLDPAEQETLECLREVGKASAPSLAREHAHAVKATAWNNRLAGLTSKGLVMQSQVGRTKYFTSVLELG